MYVPSAKGTTTPTMATKNARTPTFAIFGRSEPEFWRPLNRNFYGVRGLDKTCASAELEVVQSGIKRMLSRRDLF